MEVIVLGSGIIGLTAAIRLSEAGHRVRIRTAEPWRNTVSSVAAAIWYPFRAYPAARVDAWAARSFSVFAGDAQDPGSGVVMREGRVFWTGAEEEGGLANVPTAKIALRAEDVPGAYQHGAVTTVPVIEMPVYLGRLESRFLAGGGEIEFGAVDSLESVLAGSRLVVNCTGLGAARLAGDASVQPIRGQVIRIANPGIDRFSLDAGGLDEEVTYVIPRSTDVVLGGTATEGSWSTAVDEEAAARILARCAALDPAVRDGRVIEHRVGLRPGRPSVRLEREEMPGGAVIHDYGHGGSGVTVCWGCAEEVVRLAGEP